MVSKKKIDNRIRILMENGIRNNHRTFFVIVGDRGKDQVSTFFNLQNFQFLFIS
jgi:N-acetyltransferase 10